MSPSSQKPGRNAPCPCGSGKKYKACHGAAGAGPLPGGTARGSGSSGGDPRAEDLLAAWAQREPEVAARVEREAKARAARVEAALRAPGAPAVLAPEEDVYLTARLWGPLQALKAAGATAPELRRDAVAALVAAVREALDAPFVEGLTARLHAAGAAGGPLAPFWREAAVAFEAEPVRLVLAVLFTGRTEPGGRTAEEMVHLADLKALTQWTPEALEPYRAYLAGAGLDAAAERVALAQAWLKEHPVALAD